MAKKELDRYSPCRFCLDCKQTKENPFLQPCNCKGSVKNVHLLCLAKWRSLTVNPEARIKCQICISVFKFPTRWLRQDNLLATSVLWYILQKSYIFIFIAQVLHLHMVNQLSEAPSDTVILRYYLEDYNTYLSKTSFQVLLVTTSSLYVGYYLYLLSHVTEKVIYLQYAYVKQQKLLLTFGILLLSFIGTYTYLFPFAYTFIWFLPYVITMHNGVLHDMNNDCEILR